MNTTHTDHFGKLRSLLNEHILLSKDTWKARLRTLLEGAYKQDPARYQEQILPYLSHHLLSLDVEFEAHDEEMLSFLARLLPEEAQIKMTTHLLKDTKQVESLCDHPDLHRVTHLEFGIIMNAAHLRLFFSRAPLEHLQALSFNTISASALGTKTLQMFPHVKRLLMRSVNLSSRVIEGFRDVGCFDEIESLTLIGAECKNSDLPLLLDSRMFSKLNHLEMWVMISRGVMLLVEHPSLSSVRSLNLTTYKLHDSESCAIFASPHTQALRTLRLGINATPGQMGPKTAAAIAARPAGLEQVTLYKTGFRDADVRTIAESDFFGACTQLYFGSRELGNAAQIASLMKSAALSKLEQLTLNIPCFHDAQGVEALTAHGSPADLTALTLLRGRLDHQTLPLLAEKLLKLPNLRHLTVEHNGAIIGDAGIKAFLSSELLPRLKTLRLNNCALTDSAALQFANSNRLHDLHALELSGNKFSESVVKKLASAPNLQHLEHFACS